MRSLSVAILLVAGACTDDSPASAPVQPPVPAPAPAAQNPWMLQAHFPGPTKTEVGPIQTPAGLLTRNTERFEDQDGAFVVQWSDYPPNYVAKISRDSLYEHAALGAAAAVGGKVTSSVPLELSGFAGREVLVGDPRGGAYRARFFLVEGRLFMGAVVTSPARLGQPIVRDFFDSLRLVKTAR